MFSKLAVSLILLLSNFTALACSCGVTEIEGDYENYDYIFTGKVTSIEALITTRFNKVEFELNSFYKGLENFSGYVYSHQNGATCGYSFKLGGEYLVFSFKGKKEWENIGIALDGRPMVSLCSLTQPINASDKEFKSIINFLDNVKSDS